MKNNLTDLHSAFFAGRYHDVVAQTFDADLTPSNDVITVAVGALTFLGRREDAEAYFAAWQANTTSPELDEIVACRFFLGLAAARSGYFKMSHEILVVEAFGRRHQSLTWARALLHQGFACQCYFMGRYRAAARWALLALKTARETGFVYADMLSTDMRGHSLVQLGEFQRGMALLGQAHKQALRLGFTRNASAIACSQACYQARFVGDDMALQNLEQLVRKRSEDSYSHQGLWMEIALAKAVRGHASEANAALRKVEGLGLGLDSRRSKIRVYLTQLAVWRWQRSPATLIEVLNAVKELILDNEFEFLADALGYEIRLNRALGEHKVAEQALDRLRSLLTSSQHARARATLEQLDLSLRPNAFSEDRMSAHFRAVAARDEGAIAGLVSQGFLGLIPELLGLAPSQHVILLPTNNLLLLQNDGEVIARKSPPAWCPELLRLLPNGASKAAIVAGIWGIRSYSPERHDPPLRTMISRLRGWLAPYDKWVVADGHGYVLTAALHVAGSWPARPSENSNFLEIEDVPERLRPVSNQPKLPTSQAAADVDLCEVLFYRITDNPRATVPQLAKWTGVSRSTVQRSLRLLLAQGRIERQGFARAACYVARESTVQKYHARDIISPEESKR